MRAMEPLSSDMGSIWELSEIFFAHKTAGDEDVKHDPS